MGQMFRNLKLKFGHRFNITYLSTSPWVVAIDNFISDDEINAMRGGVPKWYDIQSEEYARDYVRNVGGGRAGLIAWCFNDCELASRRVIKRISLITSVPADNIEHFQVCFDIL